MKKKDTKNANRMLNKILITLPKKWNKMMH